MFLVFGGEVVKGCCIKVVKCLIVKSFDSFDFVVILKLNKM